MTKEFAEDTVSRAPSFLERVTRVIEDVMEGDSFVIFFDGGVMPVREPRLRQKAVETTIIDNTV